MRTSKADVMAKLAAHRGTICDSTSDPENFDNRGRPAGTGYVLGPKPLKPCRVDRHDQSSDGGCEPWPLRCWFVNAETRAGGALSPVRAWCFDCAPSTPSQVPVTLP